MLKGNLLKTDFPEILMRIYESKLTGELQVENGNIRKVVFFLGGHPVFARSNAVEDRIGRLIYESGKVSKEKLEEALRLAKKYNKKVGLVLVKMNILTAGELYELVIQQVRKIIDSLFQWESGRYIFTERSSLPQEVITLEENPASIIFNGIIRNYTEERVIKRLGTLNAVFKKIKSPFFKLPSLPLTESGIEILQAIDGKKNLKTLIKELPYSRKEILTTVYALMVLKFIEPVEMLETAEDLYRKERLVEILNKFESTNLFQWLGVTPDATREEIIEAYSRLSRKFGKEFLPAFISEEVADLCEKIFEKITEAYSFLVDEDLKKYYAGLIKSGVSTEKALNLLKKKYARQLFEEGKELYRNNKLHEAHRKFMEAIKYDPTEADYYTAVALTDLTDIEGYEPDFDEAERMLKEALNLQMHQPRNYFYLGQMYKHLGNYILAKKYLTQALEVDPNYVYAKKALEEVKKLEKMRG